MVCRCDVSLSFNVGRLTQTNSTHTYGPAQSKCHVERKGIIVNTRRLRRNHYLYKYGIRLYTYVYRSHVYIRMQCTSIIIITSMRRNMFRGCARLPPPVLECLCFTCIRAHVSKLPVLDTQVVKGFLFSAHGLHREPNGLLA